MQAEERGISALEPHQQRLELVNPTNVRSAHNRCFYTSALNNRFRPRLVCFDCGLFSGLLGGK
jgi:hypothetical protein